MRQVLCFLLLTAGLFAASKPTAPIADPKGFLDLLPGFGYGVLIETGQTMADGKPYPFRLDLNVYIPLVGPRAYLVTISGF